MPAMTPKTTAQMIDNRLKAFKAELMAELPKLIKESNARSKKTVKKTDPTKK